MTSSDKYQKFTPLEHILKRPDSYVGSIEEQTSELHWILSEDKMSMIQKPIKFRPAFQKIFDEILVNAIDQSSEDRLLDTIRVNVNLEAESITVMNTGSGIPIEIHEKEKVYIPEMIFGNLLTSSNYDDSKKRTVGGRNGYGAKLTNIFSKRFEIEIVDVKTHQKYIQIWENNMRSLTKPKITKCNNAKGYVKFTFFPDFEKFGMTSFQDDDIVALLEKRTYDACACTHEKVNVYYNDIKLNIKSFEKYVDLYIGNKKNTNRVFDKCNRWEVCVCHSPEGFKQISYVNGIHTVDGGSHVESVSSKIITELIKNYKGKQTIKNNFVKDHLFIFVKSTLENPTFTTQTKTECTSKYSSFGSRFEVTEDFIKKVSKLGIIDDALALSKHKEQRELTKTDGKKKITLKGIIKLEDANKAGSSLSADCTLILTEGDSAKTFAISGLSIIGRDRYGVFPLRGKLLNAREATVKQLIENEEINYLKQILGIQTGREYTNASQLRYGKIMILTDADNDGSHIKGLIMNAIHYLCPSLMNIEGMFCAMITPILKITKGNQLNSFYTQKDFDDWKHSNNISGWNVKYYKGLGTSTSDEAKEYFKAMDRNLVTYTWDSLSEDHLLLAFKKENADKRKEWIIDGIERNEVIEYGKETNISFPDFINKDLIHFSIADCDRSIPHLVDGLKPSQRKIIYAMRKRGNKEIKVSQLAGYVSSETSYHHGEASMMSTIINLAQTHVGSNNWNLLKPNGGFGTRLLGGKDAASPRYIFTMLTDKCLKLFIDTDDKVLTYLEDDGTSIEPEFFVPTLPLILINGADGIGTGFSCNIPCYNPEDIKENINFILNGKQQKQMIPWYSGFTGTIESNETFDSFLVKGVYKQINKNTIEITELPIGMWTTDYKAFLEDILDVKVQSYINNSTESTVKFTIKYFPDKFKDIWKYFKLTKTLKTTNMHLYDSNNNMKKYVNPQQIITEFVDVRLKYYTLRKDNIMKNLSRELNILQNKVRFIDMIVNDTLIVFKQQKKQIIEKLKEHKFNTVDKTFDYLLDMKIHFLTDDQIKKFEKDKQTIDKKIRDLEKLSNIDMWKKEL